MEEKQKLAFQSIIARLIKFLSRITAKINDWISDLKYYSYMLDFGSREDDIWICTFMKSGTTLTQMMLYQLTTDGNMNFRHINDVSPWVRNASLRKLKPAQIPAPRILKSHDPYHKFDKNTKGRFIFVLRDGLDVAVSYYHHRKNYNQPDLTFDELYEQHFIKKGDLNWFTYVQQWLENKNKFNILYLRYEDIINDFDNTLEKVIKFCNLKPDEATIERVKERCSFQFMKQHEDKFGIERLDDKRVLDQFIRKGKPGEGKEFASQEQKEIFRKNFQKSLGRLNEKMQLNYRYN